MNPDRILCQSCGAVLSAGDLACAACGARAAASIKAEEAERDFEARLSELPPEAAQKIRDLTARHEERPDSTATCIQLSAAYNDAGMRDMAIRYMEMAARLDPDNKFLAQKLRLLVAGPGGAAESPELDAAIRTTRAASRLVWRGLAAALVLAAVLVGLRLAFPPVRRVAHFEKHDALSPRYSPDGTKIAFVKAPKFTIFGMVDMLGGGSPGDSSIMVADAGGGEAREVVKFRSGWSAGGFAWIPGTDDIAYVDYDEETYLPILYRVPSAGGEPVALANARDFAWSPSGKTVAYVGVDSWEPERQMRPGEEDGYLYILNTDLNYAQKISELSCSHPSFSPDGRLLAFQALEQDRWTRMWKKPGAYRTEDDPPEEIPQVMDLANATKVFQSAKSRDSLPDTADSIAYVGDIFVHDLDAGVTARLTASGMNQEPVFTPDGSRIAYLTYGDDWQGFDNELYVMNPDGGDQRRLIAKGEMYEGFRSFAFHPGGEWLIFEGVFVNPNKPKSAEMQTPLGMVGGYTNYVADLFAVRVDGSDLHRLPKKKFDYRSQPGFSPDGSWMAFEVEYVDIRREAWTMKF